MKQILTIIGLFLFLPLFSQANNSSKKEFILFEKENYSIEYPDKWKLESPGSLMEAFCLYGPIENEYVYINFINDNEKWQGKIEDFIENGVNEYLRGFEIVKRERIDNSTCKIQFQDTVGEDVFKSIRYFYLVDGNVYVLTFCAKDKVFDLYLDQADLIINTFKINGELMNNTQ